MIAALLPILEGLTAEGGAAAAIGGSTQSGLKGVTEGMTKLNAITGPVGQAFGLLWGTIGKGVSQVQELVGAIAGLVKIANPAAFKMYSDAVEDLQGVFGGMLMPVLQSITGVVRSVADSFANMDGLGGLFKTLGQGITQVWSVLGPIFRAIVVNLDAWASVFNALLQQIGNNWGPLIPLMQLMAEAVLKLAEAFRYTVGILLSAAGYKIPGSSNKNSSFGAAAGNASYSSFEDVGKNATKQAFAMSLGGVDPNQRAEQQRDTTNQKLDLIISAITGIPSSITGLGTKLLFGS